MKKHNKTTQRKRRIKRCIRRVLTATAMLTVLLCVGVTLYILLLEYGIVKLNSKNQVIVEDTAKSVDKSFPNREIDNMETDLDEELKQSDEETTVVNEGMVDSLEETQYTVGTIGEVDMQNVNLLETTLHLIPTELLNHYYKSGGKNCVTDENIGETYMNDTNQYNAAIVWGKMMIVVEDRPEAINGVIHEFGHYLDGVNNRPSASDEFCQIYQEEVETFKVNTIDGDCVYNQSEFFAQTFYYYILDPSKCTPKAYQFIESQLKILEERSL